MSLRHGLQARFVGLLALMLLFFLSVLVVLWHRQERMQEQVEATSRAAMREMANDTLRRNAESVVGEMALAMANPLYYFDLDEIGRLGQTTLRQPGTRYVQVFDAQGRIVHDGSEDIPGYGQAMDDPLAYEAVAARRVHTQVGGDIMDVSAPISIGSQRIGGVRAGFDLNVVRQHQERASSGLRSQLQALGQQHLLWIGLLSGVLAALGVAMAWLIQRFLVQPISDLADAARSIEAGRFDTPLPASQRRDEIGDLMNAFSRMGASVARHDREIRRMAYTDALTGLHNRLAFREALDQRLLTLHGAGRQLALLFADIDDFKRINDTLGHEAGDDVLVQFANRIQDVVQQHGGDGALLARFGGDEFVILVESGSGYGDEIRSAATRLAEALVEVLGQPLMIEGRQVFLGTSVGITLFPEDASGATSLMKNGDIAMYQAKVAGKNCYRFYSRAMDQAVERRVQMEHELRGAWDRGELSLAYQPVFDLAEGTMVGAEALLRWRHPKHGLVAPSVFIEVAEQSGLIEVLGPRVLRAACRDAVRWNTRRSGDRPLFVSVNVSPRQLRSGDLPKVVAAILAETGLSARQLHLELTETAVIGDEVHAGNLLSRLRQTGVKVWLDDFGTGFSGLSHLRRVPVDGVKIDRSFIADILRDPDDLALTTAIIAMAHSLGITVVAEGVEKEGQYALLRERGCDLAQGYWIGHPVAVDEFLSLLD
ncbi:putative bifunctional diguanylate cyclase/phosphodiesterase [Aerolutibacter ruishenii]|uniref:Diguanylate cyclase (GGDEF)-like protein n=1 Tax=Aerolutibacter ruishenii TaxID=686800 RepID=A0A562LSM9_9GAMM|nr:GGDEF domain-containing phosphodiesterase [Lysobacter ruishenii]TWI10647.1 diguanylate cyclase (GGDEF)-like protein [Lysobacter ruishenii]